MAQEEHKEWAFSFLGICPSHVKCTSGSFDLGGLEPLSSRSSPCLSAGFPRCSLGALFFKWTKKMLWDGLGPVKKPVSAVNKHRVWRCSSESCARSLLCKIRRKGNNQRIPKQAFSCLVINLLGGKKPLNFLQSSGLCFSLMLIPLDFFSSILPFRN